MRWMVQTQQCDQCTLTFSPRNKLACIEGLIPWKLSLLACSSMAVSCSSNAWIAFKMRSCLFWSFAVDSKRVNSEYTMMFETMSGENDKECCNNGENAPRRWISSSSIIVSEAILRHSNYGALFDSVTKPGTWVMINNHGPGRDKWEGAEDREVLRHLLRASFHFKQQFWKGLTMLGSSIQ